MVGLGILFRIARIIIAKPLENTGLLPTRYYLNETLKSLDQDNIGQAVKLLKISKGAFVDKARWELVRQQVLFRCRVLMDKHGKRIQSIENRVREIEIPQKSPLKWFRKKPAKRPTHYEDVLALERRARSLLEKYEGELKHL